MSWVSASLSAMLTAMSLTMVDRTTSLPHETIILSQNLSGTVHQYYIDGATIMSQEYYNEDELYKSIILMPHEISAHLLVQFVYLDIPRQKPCRDFLNICEWKFLPHKCGMPVVKDFCGGLSDLFPGSKYTDTPHFIATSQSGHGILIQWNVKDPYGHHRGFQIIVTAFIPEESCRSSSRHWKCSDGRCISTKLHCDGIAHCTDGSDELVNCTRTGFVLPEHDECSLWNSSHCPSQRWRERWFGLAIPMIIVMALLFITVVVRIRKQLCRAQGSAGRRSRQSYIPPALLMPRSQACTLQPVVGHRHSPAVSQYDSYEGHTVMLLPPPYSPPECIQYGPPANGEPPPLYEDCVNVEQECLNKPTCPLPERPEPSG